MSHADDGTLHAYLDGELSAMEVVRLEAHVAECVPCRARLEEERLVLHRAGQILARAEPPVSERPAPSLDALRRQRVSWPVAPLAWAAIAVIVVGGGWFTRSLISERGTPSAPDPPVSTLATEQLPAAPAGTPAASDEAERKAATPSTLAAEADTPARREAIPRPAAGIAAASPDTSPRIALAQPPAPAPAPAVPLAAQRETLERRRLADSVAPAPPPAAREALAAPGRAVLQQNVAMAWPPITTDSARALLGSDIAVIPDLPLRGIRGSVLGDSVVLVEQGVGSDPGVMIRLYQRRASAAPGLLGGERLARYVGPLRVEILGPLPADSLSKLLERARPIR